ncbi:LacI family DNA-binding transcriptional regulator [Halobacillus shinanisalinarum]|uniref:LacI family DNA-binding transcriptional regulator n=1 Tax=Halobacillus shinanisalinarum TaxID=2932258 RepID=A0ABY4H2Z0_9BACI|nr:LacI family DNA-binding transcriptional regulator [Halobacillus shinanisalinarum]UOQ94484.1 LacI family DNA-binding transcriptional regulator [Halobacillus shinanisalinarum]
MSVTIKDVAKQANVAPSTVSRVISNNPRISEKTKRKVRKVMEEMGYHLNFNARVLVSQSTQTIGIVMKNSSSHSFENPFFSELLRGISRACNENDYGINLTTGESEEAIYNDVVKMVQGKRVDGIIVLYSKKDDKVVPYLMEHDFPFVMIGKPLVDSSNVMYVDNDNVQASRNATNFLVNLGHEKIGFIGGDSHFEVANARLEGFKYAANEHKLNLPESYLRNIEIENGDSTQIINELMDLSEPPTALVITDDFNALKVMATLQERNIKMPEEVSIIGFNNTMIAKLSNPPLTTVDTNSYQLGYESGQSLIQLLHDPKMLKRSVIVPTTIVERESCIKKDLAGF